jgi:hypothetical protein
MMPALQVWATRLQRHAVCNAGLSVEDYPIDRSNRLTCLFYGDCSHLQPGQGSKYTQRLSGSMRYKAAEGALLSKGDSRAPSRTISALVQTHAHHLKVPKPVAQALMCVVVLQPTPLLPGVGGSGGWSTCAHQERRQHVQLSSYGNSEKVLAKVRLKSTDGLTGPAVALHWLQIVNVGQYWSVCWTECWHHVAVDGAPFYIAALLLDWALMGAVMAPTATLSTSSTALPCSGAPEHAGTCMVRLSTCASSSECCMCAIQAVQELDAVQHKHDREVEASLNKASSVYVQDSAKLLDEKQQRLVPGFIQVLDTANERQPAGGHLPPCRGRDVQPSGAAHGLAGVVSP